MTHISTKTNPSKYSKGFTLIELLVVIAIIGLLSSIVLAALNTARERGRDAKRLSDLEQVQNALEEYESSNNGNYPSTVGIGCPGNACGTCSGFGSKGVTGATGWVPNLAPTYISVLPTDPLPLSNGLGCYIYESDGTDYMLEAYGTVESYTLTTNPKNNPDTKTTTNSFAFYTPGAVNNNPHNW
jgi:prepilin-type N-terminal cleavage/methylation domain-containing protein